MSSKPEQYFQELAFFFFFLNLKLKFILALKEFSRSSGHPSLKSLLEFFQDLKVFISFLICHKVCLLKFMQSFEVHLSPKNAFKIFNSSKFYGGFQALNAIQGLNVFQALKELQGACILSDFINLCKILKFILALKEFSRSSDDPSLKVFQCLSSLKGLHFMSNKS